MTRLFNEPAAFADEMIEGFVASHGRWVKRVSGGVVRNTKSTPDTVALVIGGGSGHYPAFAGLVGQGLAHGFLRWEKIILLLGFALPLLTRPLAMHLHLPIAPAVLFALTAAVVRRGQALAAPARPSPGIEPAALHA